MIEEAAGLERAGCILEARLAYQNALRRQGNNIQALVALGRIALQGQQPRAAIPHFQKAVKLTPGSVALRNHLAIAFLEIGRPDKAAPHALRAYKLDKTSVETLDVLQKVYRYLGKPFEAQTALESALALCPDDPTFTLKLASHHDLCGELEKARTLYRGLIDRGQATAQAYYGLVNLETFAAEPPELAAIEALLLDSQTTLADRELLHRAAGKIADDLGRYDEAFAHFSAAGASQVQVRRAEGDASARIQRLKEAPDTLPERARFSNPSRRPVFVFGMPRSGTTLIEQILASHRDVYAAGELAFFRYEPLDATDVTEKQGREIAREYLQLLAAHAPIAKRVVDKMPHNFQRLALLAQLFPNASFIHCRRDPLATCMSCFMRPLRGTYFQAGDLSSIGKYYRQYHELMSWWRRSLNVPVLEIDYEQLVVETDREARRLIAHVGLEWDDACLRFHETRRLIMTPSRRQVEQPMYTSSLHAWRNYTKHLGPLIEVLGDLVPAEDRLRVTGREP